MKHIKQCYQVSYHCEQLELSPTGSYGKTTEQASENWPKQGAKKLKYFPLASLLLLATATSGTINSPVSDLPRVFPQLWEKNRESQVFKITSSFLLVGYVPRQYSENFREYWEEMTDIIIYPEKSDVNEQGTTQLQMSGSVRWTLED